MPESLPSQSMASGAAGVGAHQGERRAGESATKRLERCRGNGLAGSRSHWADWHMATRTAMGLGSIVRRGAIPHTSLLATRALCPQQ
eukprot:152965-Pyramimonas_sp.AAC.1